MKNNKRSVLFAIYILVIFWVLLFKFSVSFTEIKEMYDPLRAHINFVPFGESAMINGQVSHAELLLNVLIFVPLGVSLQLTRKNLVFSFFMMLGLSVLIESAQYVFSLGATDVTDVITNVSGGVLGLLLCVIIRLLLPGRIADKFLVGCLYTGVVIIVLIVLYFVLQHYIDINLPIRLKFT
jgi:glycopeptide antibiotics resistance protein